MASLLTVRLNKGDSPNLGFRLQGGKDFGTPLVIQKVNGGSPAERAGLLAGDSVIKINNVDVFNLRHKDAQDVIVRSGPAFEVTVQRGGSTWKPSVTPTGTTLTSPTPSIQSVSPVTKTSLAATKKDNVGAIGTGHNVSAKPFAGQLNGTVNGGGPRVVNNQYNSPLKLYSEESIAETLSAQTEVLSTGALGVNFKKNEKNYDATNSAVYRMLQEAEKEPKQPEAINEPDSGVVTAPLGVAGLRRVAAPETKPTAPSAQLPPGQNVCADCERLIVGVFVRIKDKNLHVECFKCSTCGTSLKNVGYYNINNKLYCDVHAKLAARNNPPGPNLLPVTVPPGGKAPINAISAALSSHSLPSPSPLSPKSNLAQPFQPSQDIKEVESAPSQNLLVTSQTNSYNKYNNSLLNTTPLSFDRFISKAGNYSSPKPFASVNAPTYNTLPRAAAPLSPVVPSIAPPFSPSTEVCTVQNIIWPPPSEEPDVPTACPLYFPPPSQVKVKTLPRPGEEPDFTDDSSEGTSLELEELNLMDPFQLQLQQPGLLYSADISTGRRSAVDCIETISEKVETQKLVESRIKSSASSGPPPLDQDVIPLGEEGRNTVSLKQCDQESTVNVGDSSDSKLKRLTEFAPNTVECKLKSQVENAIPQRWESPLLQALKTIPGENDPFSQIPTKFSATPLASALAVAPSDPFMPPLNPTQAVSLPEETEPYFPPEHPLITVETQEQSAPRGPKKKNPADDVFKDLPKPERKMTMRDALTIASDRSYTPVIPDSATEIREEPKAELRQDKQEQKPLKTKPLPATFQAIVSKPIMSSYPLKTLEKHEEYIKEKSKYEEQINVSESSSIQHIQQQEVSSVTAGEAQPHLYPMFTGFSCSFANKTDHSQFTIEISTTPPVPSTDAGHTSTVTRNEAITSSKTETLKKESQEVTKQSQITADNVVVKKPSPVIGAQSSQVPQVPQVPAQVPLEVVKQAEDVIVKKAVPAVSLHKPEGLPQYQVALSENAEADLLLIEKQQAASQFLEKQKLSVQQQQIQTQSQTQMQKPIITVQSEDVKASSEQYFRPVVEDRAPKTTFSPRPGALTPSMINKPPPIIPYYQYNLVAQPCRPVSSSLLDPTSPNISRSPSPCPERCPSPFGGSSTIRPKSPAQGPPPSLKPPKPAKDPRIEEAKTNLTQYIPQYQTKTEQSCNLKAHKSEISGQSTLQSSRQVQGRVTATNVQLPQYQTKTEEICKVQKVNSDECGACNLKQSHKSSRAVSEQATPQYQSKTEICKFQNVNLSAGQGASEQSSITTLQSADLAAQYSSSRPVQGGVMTTNVSQKAQSQHLAQLSQSKVSTVEQSSDGRVQVQRTKRVKEEFESVHKSNVTQIEKSVTSQAGFKNIKTEEQQGILGFHSTNPQPLKSPFLDGTKLKSEDTARTEQALSSALKASVDQNKSAIAPPPPPPAPTPVSIPAAPVAPLTKHVTAPSLNSPIRHVTAPAAAAASKQKPGQSDKSLTSPPTNAGSTGGRQAGAIGVTPKRGRGIFNPAAIGGARVALCGQCHNQIRGPFITALGKIWCPDHFICATPSCRRPLHDLGFVEERGQLYCEYCFEQYLAPACSKCNYKIKEDCLKAIGKHFHPECFSCAYCGKQFANSPFFLEEGNPYCEADWNELFTTKCYACGFPVEAGDRWVEALNNNYHSQCFNCTMCKKNLEGQSFFAKGGRPFCKNHAR